MPVESATLTAVARYRRVWVDRRKDVFLATLSHELRNPLAPIRTAARLLETPSPPPAELDALMEAAVAPAAAPS